MLVCRFQLPDWADAVLLLRRRTPHQSLSVEYHMARVGSFGARPCRAIREKLLAGDTTCLPPSWRRKWMIQRIIATPPWANFFEIRKIYLEVQRLNQTTNCKWTVGHIIPLNHPRVCGLHVHQNLQPEIDGFNFRKGNSWCEWHGEMFTEPEQLRMF
jgi:hypothetical protein